jgi:hypothetical protein
MKAIAIGDVLRLETTVVALNVRVTGLVFARCGGKRS